MLVIRLQPNGRKKRIAYRIVVSERRSKLGGAATDDLGYFNPLVTPADLVIDRKKLQYWKDHGATVSPRVQQLLTSVE